MTARRFVANYWARIVVMTAVLWALTTCLWGHHSAAAVFDLTKRISVTGTLTKVDWSNPHVVLSMEVKGDDGKIQLWTFESNPPSWYRSLGLSRADLARAVGQTITVEGARAKDRAAYGYVQKMRFPDGTTLNLFTAPGSYK